MKRFLLAVALACHVGGCAAVVASLPVVIAAVTDAVMVLDAIEDHLKRHFTRFPDVSREEQVHAAMLRARAALNAALRAAQGAEKLTQEQIDEAFAEFRAAYTDLLALVQPFGVVPQGGGFRATPGGLVVPEPLALHLKVSR